jgi:hypothetical protein
LLTDPVCLLRYEESREWCLFLVPDDSEELWPIERFVESILLRRTPNQPYKLLTLRELLTAFDLYELRRTVQLILARSVLLLFQGLWIGATSGRRLTLDELFLYCAMDGDIAYPSFDHVYMSTSFLPADGTSITGPSCLSHPFVDLLRLSILIGEIEQQSGSQGQMRDEPYAKQLRDKCAERYGRTTGAFVAMNFCIERKSFTRHLETMDRKCPQEHQGFMQDCYDHIIRPLEHELRAGEGWTLDEITWKCPRQRPRGSLGHVRVSSASSTPHTEQSTFAIPPKKCPSKKRLARTSPSLESISEVQGYVSSNSRRESRFTDILKDHPHRRVV